MLDVASADFCGACHEGAPARPTPSKLPAPGATPCTKCHDGESGPLSCDTCHREPAGHAPHLRPSAAKAEGIPCSACHPVPKLGELTTGTHGDGRVEVWLPEGPSAFDGTTKECATRCHAGPSAARPKPAWTDPTPMTCKDCHGAPPTPHLAGACSNCHREANAAGDALLATRLHLDGVVELGDGSGTCGACHGSAADPSPPTGAHAAHASPTMAVKVACATCHALPVAGVPHPEGKPAVVRLSGLAAKGGLAPTYDTTTKTCASVYCHSLRSASIPAPAWNDGPSVSACGSCHGIPPGPPHTTSSACGTGTCHGNSVSGGALTPAGIAHHVDGKTDLSIP